MNPYIVLALVAGLFGAGFKLGVDHQQAAQSREDRQVERAVEAGTKAAASAIAQLKPTYTTIQGKLEKQIETNTVFRDCRLDAVSLQLANQALAGGTATTGDGKLPKTDAAGK